MGHYVNSDLVGPLKPGIHGFKYVCSLQDGFSRHIHLTPLKDKSALSVATAFHDYGCMFEFPNIYHTSTIPQVYSTDRGQRQIPISIVCGTAEPGLEL